MPHIAAVATVTPPHAITQSTARDFALEHFRHSGLNLERLAPVFDHAGIERRYSCMPPSWFREPHEFGDCNRLYIEWATRLGAEAARRCCERAPRDTAGIDQIIFVFTNGLATRSIDARLANVLGLRPDIRRTPLWGLGCAGGASGLAHAYRAALADPATTILLVAVELCSLTFNNSDLSKSNFIATALFADGAAAVLVQGDDVQPARAGVPTITAASSTMWPDSLDVMGWNFDSVGMQVVFARSIPRLVREKSREVLGHFLKRHSLGFADLGAVVIHPGGTKVLEAYQESLPLDASHFEPARAVLREYGNMSSPTVLFVLERVLRDRPQTKRAPALLSALGPGFSSESLLLEL